MFCFITSKGLEFAHVCRLRGVNVIPIAKYRTGSQDKLQADFNFLFKFSQGSFGYACHSLILEYFDPVGRKAQVKRSGGSQMLHEDGTETKFSKDFVDTHELVLHAYNSKKCGRRAEHMGLHKALCVLMGWNHLIPPDDTRSYQSLASLEAMSNKEDLILWPPLVIVHNACIGKDKDGRWEGIGNPEMDELLKDIGFGSGKSKALYGRDGHQGIILIKFLPTLAGLQEAERLQKYFEGHRRGRKDWLRVESLHSSQQINDDDVDLVRIDKETKEKKRVLYGYIGISGDLDKVDFDTRKRVLVKSRKDIEF